MIKFIQALGFALWMQTKRTPGLRYYKHLEGKFLYLLISEKYIPEGEEKKFLKMFDKATTTTKFRFNFEAVYKETEIVEVMDDEIHDENYPDESSFLKNRAHQYKQQLIQAELNKRKT